MTEKNRVLSAVVCVILFFVILFPQISFAGETYETLRIGSRSIRVREIKNRLRELRYLKKGQYNNEYTEKTAEAVRLFQRINGLTETGEVDRDTETVLFSNDAIMAPWPTLEPLATPAPVSEPDWPERDGYGFLDGTGEYFYENEEEGFWIYLSSSLQIYIRKNHDSDIPLEWFETEILTRDEEMMKTVLTDPERPGKVFRYPDDIAVDNRLVLGFSDDFFADRMQRKLTVGIIIREGKIISENTYKKTGHNLPNLDMMAQYPDGRFEVYTCNELTAQELLERGAVNVFSFGPILIRDGEINELVYEQYYRSLEPRQALGMIEPNHYYLLSVLGRNDASKGTVLQRVAEMMKNKGVQQALNLDGGNTLALVFRGKILNKKAIYKKKAFYRSVTSLIGFGDTDTRGK